MTSKIKYPTIWCPRTDSDTPIPIAELCTFWKYTIEIVPASHRLQDMASQQGWNDVKNEVPHYLMSADLFETPTPIAQLCTFWNIRLKLCPASHRLQAMASDQGCNDVENLSILLSHVRWFIRDSHPHSTSCVHFEIYDWNCVCITPLASYGNTTQQEWNDVESQVSHYMMPTD